MRRTTKKKKENSFHYETIMRRLSKRVGSIDDCFTDELYRTVKHFWKGMSQNTMLRMWIPPSKVRVIITPHFQHVQDNLCEMRCQNIESPQLSVKLFFCCICARSLIKSLIMRLIMDPWKKAVLHHLCNGTGWRGRMEARKPERHENWIEPPPLDHTKRSKYYETTIAVLWDANAT